MQLPVEPTQLSWCEWQISNLFVYDAFLARMKDYEPRPLKFKPKDSE